MFREITRYFFSCAKVMDVSGVHDLMDGCKADEVGNSRVPSGLVII